MYQGRLVISFEQDVALVRMIDSMFAKTPKRLDSMHPLDEAETYG